MTSFLCWLKQYPVTLLDEHGTRPVLAIETVFLTSFSLDISLSTEKGQKMPEDKLDEIGQYVEMHSDLLPINS